MKDRLARLTGLLCSIGYAGFIAWLYGQQPQTVSQITGGVAATLGQYDIDGTSFDDGLRFFRSDQFPEARASFERADPARQDSRTQFYVAYSYYREGWGRLYHDDALYKKGLDAIERAVASSPDSRVVVDDPDLGMQSSDELKAELQRGITRESSDFNPMRLFRKRK